MHAIAATTRLVIAFTLAGLVGCASSVAERTRLQLAGNPRGPAVYEFRQTLYRDAGAGVELIGYGQAPFDNSPSSMHHDPRWPSRGFVTFRLHVVPAGDAYQITILGPSGAVGPGDSEVLSGGGRPVSVDQTDDARRLRFRDVTMRSRNHPGQSFTLSGTLVARHGSPDEFQRQLRAFETELSYRGPQ
jgi:hypothetical protein